MQGTVVVRWQKTQGIDGAGANTSQQGTYMAITHMPQYQNYSFEELRVQDYQASRKRADPQTLARSIATASTKSCIMIARSRVDHHGRAVGSHMGHLLRCRAYVRSGSRSAPPTGILVLALPMGLHACVASVAEANVALQRTDEDFLSDRNTALALSQAQVKFIPPVTAVVHMPDAFSMPHGGNAFGGEAGVQDQPGHRTVASDSKTAFQPKADGSYWRSKVVEDQLTFEKGYID